MNQAAAKQQNRRATMRNMICEVGAELKQKSYSGLTLAVELGVIAVLIAFLASLPHTAMLR